MTTRLRQHLGIGGALLNRDNPESLYPLLADLITQLNAVADGTNMVNNGVLMGLRVGTPTTASDQLTGAGGNLDWNVDVEGGSCLVNDVEGNFEPEADFDVTNGSAIIEDGQSVYAWLVASESGGTVSKEAVLGVAATTDAQVIPTDAEIATGVGHANWAKIALLLVNRTGDTTVTQVESVKDQSKLLGSGAAIAKLVSIE